MMIPLKRALLHVCRAMGLFRLARRMTRDRLRILGYHGFALADEDRFRPGTFMRPAVFRRRLEYLARSRTPVLPLGQALEMLSRGTLPPCATVITIDDGFASTYSQAAELLRSFCFPATVYVSSYYCRYPNPVFRLAVQYMFWKSPSSPLPLAGEGQDDAMWSIIRHGETACDEAGRVQLAEELGRRLGVDYAEIRRSRILSLMTPDEFRRLPGFGLDVQLHTHRHRFPEEPACAAQEIADNRAFLQTVTDRPLVHFCYPSGEWSERSWRTLDEMGIESAVTCDRGLNDATTPRFALRRFLDGQNVSQIEFEAEVSGFLDLARRLLGRRREAPAA